MTDEKKTMQETVRVPQRVPGFDPMKFAQEVGKAGEKVLALKYKKAWFRAACPNGGVVLNPVRVTDQRAIFEARLFADTEDRNPLASFTATRAADKDTGKRYIQAAQEAALNEALENAGFGLPLIPMVGIGGQNAAPAVQVETEPKTAGDGQPEESSPATETEQPVKKVTENVQPAPKKDTPPQQPKSENKASPHPAPVAPQPRFQKVTETNSSVVDIATAKAAGKETQPAVRQEHPEAAEPPAADTEPVQETSAPATADAPVTYTADMTVEEISRIMTLEQAKKIKVQDGTCKGWTLEQVAIDRPPSLKWLKFTAPFADNVLKAAAGIVLADLELKKAG